MVCKGVVWGGGGGKVCRGVVWTGRRDGVERGGVGMVFRGVVWREGVWSRVCNRLSGYSGYSDIRKNLSVRIAT